MQDSHKIQKYCHDFFGSAVLLHLQGHQYEVTLLTSPEVRATSWCGLLRPFIQPHLLFFKAIGERCIA